MSSARRYFERLSPLGGKQPKLTEHSGGGFFRFAFFDGKESEQEAQQLGLTNIAAKAANYLLDQTLNVAKYSLYQSGALGQGVANDFAGANAFDLAGGIDLSFFTGKNGGGVGMQILSSGLYLNNGQSGYSVANIGADLTSIGNGIASIGNAIGNAANWVGNAVGDAANWTANAISDAANFVGNGVSSAATWAYNVGSDVVNTLGAMVPPIGSPASTDQSPALTESVRRNNLISSELGLSDEDIAANNTSDAVGANVNEFGPIVDNNSKFVTDANGNPIQLAYAGADWPKFLPMTSMNENQNVPNYQSGPPVGTISSELGLSASDIAANKTSDAGGANLDGSQIQEAPVNNISFSDSYNKLMTTYNAITSNISFDTNSTIASVYLNNSSDVVGQGHVADATINASGQINVYSFAAQDTTLYNMLAAVGVTVPGVTAPPQPYQDLQQFLNANSSDPKMGYNNYIMAPVNTQQGSAITTEANAWVNGTAGKNNYSIVGNNCELAAQDIFAAGGINWSSPASGAYDSDLYGFGIYSIAQTLTFPPSIIISAPTIIFDYNYFNNKGTIPNSGYNLGVQKAQTMPGWTYGGF
jgi:hypothetical protein